jgi:hypothetical protein
VGSVELIAILDGMLGSDAHADSSVAELFSQYRSILRELRRRGIVRTENAPAGDYAEFLVATALGGSLAPNSEKSYDVAAGGRRLQVKCRVVSDQARPGQLQLSPFRSFDFDDAVIVLLSGDNYAVSRAVRVPVALLQAAARFNAHVNGHIVDARPSLLTGPGTEDLTERLRAVS